jgi:hypothetical protein
MSERAATARFKLTVDAELKRRVEAVFARQGVTTTEGMTRLLRWFVTADDLQPIVLNQVRGAGAKQLLRGMMKRTDKS